MNPRDCEWEVVDCECEVVDLGDGEITYHDSDCPFCWSDLHTADDIANERTTLMLWLEDTADDPDAAASAAEMAEGITARAVQLGLETPDHRARPE